MGTQDIVKPEETAAPAAPAANRIVGDSFWNDSDKLAHVQRCAMMLSSSELVPDAYRGKKAIGSCVIAIDIAERLRASPLLVMQNLYIVHGRPAWSAQFLIATFNMTGRFKPIGFQFTGEPGNDSHGCQAVTYEMDKDGNATGEPIIGPLITIALAKKDGWYNKKGSKWQSMPEQMLRYRAAAWLIRTLCPEIAMGIHTIDEVRDSEPEAAFTMADDQQALPPMSAATATRTGRLAAKLTQGQPAEESETIEADAKVIEPNNNTPTQEPDTDDPEPTQEQEQAEGHANPEPEREAIEVFESLRSGVLQAATVEDLEKVANEMQMDQGSLSDTQLTELRTLIDAAAKEFQRSKKG